MKTFFLFCLLLFIPDTSSAQEIAVLDFEFFKYEKRVYLVALFGTTVNDSCETAAVIRCEYKDGDWVPGDDLRQIECNVAQEMIKEIRDKKSNIKRGRMITYALLFQSREH
jgi:hypothetical protein